jgi:hypothetical protein
MTPPAGGCAYGSGEVVLVLVKQAEHRAHFTTMTGESSHAAHHPEEAAGIERFRWAARPACRRYARDTGHMNNVGARANDPTLPSYLIGRAVFDSTSADGIEMR